MWRGRERDHKRGVSESTLKRERERKNDGGERDLHIITGGTKEVSCEGGEQGNCLQSMNGGGETRRK